MAVADVVESIEGIIGIPCLETGDARPLPLIGQRLENPIVLGVRHGPNICTHETIPVIEGRRPPIALLKVQNLCERSETGSCKDLRCVVQELTVSIGSPESKPRPDAPLQLQLATVEPGLASVGARYDLSKVGIHSGAEIHRGIEVLIGKEVRAARADVGHS